MTACPQESWEEEEEEEEYEQLEGPKACWICSPVSGNVDLTHHIKQKSFLNSRVLCAVLVASCDYTLAHLHGYLPRSEC